MLQAEIGETKIIVRLLVDSPHVWCRENQVSVRLQDPVNFAKHCGRFCDVLKHLGTENGFEAFTRKWQSDAVAADIGRNVAITGAITIDADTPFSSLQLQIQIRFLAATNIQQLTTCELVEGVVQVLPTQPEHQPVYRKRRAHFLRCYWRSRAV